MTNWMTATGIAFIAGGLATLICFRRVLWSGQRRNRGRAAIERRAARARAIEEAQGPALGPGPADGMQSTRASAVLPAQADAPDISGAHLKSVTPTEVEASLGPRRSRRRGRGGVSRLARANVERDEDERAGLASIGLADEEATGPDEGDLQQHDERPEEVMDHMDDDDAKSDKDRVLGRRNEHSDPPTGDYWMPVPESAYVDLDSADYAMPVRRDRDPAVESEPTAVVPLWPPARPPDRIGMPGTWSDGPRLNRRTLRETTGRRWEDADRNGDRRQHRADGDVAGRHWDQPDRDGHDGWRRPSGPEDERLTFPGSEHRRRPRPRPNPAAEARSTVYVSRHAAELD